MRSPQINVPPIPSLILPVVSLILGSCATSTIAPTPPAPAPPATAPSAPAPKPPSLPSPPPISHHPWETIAPGIALLEQFDFSSQVDRPLTGTAAKIDLTTPGLHIITTPGNGSRPGETDGLRTTTFLKKHHCLLAINAAPYSPIHLFEGQAQEIAGLHISSGETISPANSYPTLSFRPGTATIGPPSTARGSTHAVAGFKIILQNGQARKNSSTTLHPRTAAGISASSHTIYLLVLDGRQPGRSEGATEEETGKILQNLGASSGINLDGGGTTAMAIKNPSGGARLLNTPINAGIPGLERIAASHLGVRLQ